MAIFDRLTMKAFAAGAGLCGIAISLSSAVAADPTTTGGECAPGAPPAKECVAAAAPVANMAGVPMALPGPVPVVPAAPVLPVIPAAPVPVVPAAAPAAPLPAGAPVAMAGGFGGKGDPVAPPDPGAPVPGQPLPAGPSAAG